MDEKLEKDMIWYDFEQFAKLYSDLGIEGIKLTNFLLWRLLKEIEGK